MDAFRAHGGKFIALLSANDPGIFPRELIYYYRQMAVRYGGTGRTDFKELNKFYRLFRAPDYGHCGASGAAKDAFDALVKWVEQNVAPEGLTVAGGDTAPAGGRTRLACVYPTTAIYKGSGSTDDASNFYCGGNLETNEAVCRDVLTSYKHEKAGGLDFRDTGVNPRICRQFLGTGPVE
jgi:feruloyl esterase